jgi:enhancing lycopene biosynthesis protein 2
MFAPNKDQHHTINHVKGEEQTETRNILVESARIARGDIADLKKLDPTKFDGLIFPGGFGVAKNLCDFAFNGAQASVDEDVMTIINQFHEAKKPIVGICIAPALLALCLRDKGIEITIGTDQGTAEQLELLGAKHTVAKVDTCIVDQTNKLITTPAYMIHTSLDKIAAGIDASIEKLVELS